MLCSRMATRSGYSIATGINNEINVSVFHCLLAVNARKTGKK